MIEKMQHQNKSMTFKCREKNHVESQEVKIKNEFHRRASEKI